MAEPRCRPARSWTCQAFARSSTADRPQDDSTALRYERQYFSNHNCLNLRLSRHKVVDNPQMRPSSTSGGWWMTNAFMPLRMLDYEARPPQAEPPHLCGVARSRAHSKTCATCFAATSREKRASQRRRPAAPILLRISLSSLSRASVAYHSSGPCANKPVSPSLRMSRFAPIGEATAARPAAMYWMIL